MILISFLPKAAYFGMYHHFSRDQKPFEAFKVRIGMSSAKGKWNRGSRVRSLGTTMTKTGPCHVQVQ